MKYTVEYKPDSLKGTNKFLELSIHKDNDEYISGEDIKKILEEQNIKPYQVLNIFREEQCCPVFFA